jgi:AcrR family transcriptional regulator
MRVLARAGANGASVRAIAQEAGVSPGLVGHYFTGIDALIAETYTHVDAMVTRALDAAVAAAPPLPRARLEAFVTASFTAPIAQPALLATWIAFWSLVTSQPQIARQHDEQYAGYRARLEFAARSGRGGSGLAPCGDCGDRAGRRAVAGTVPVAAVLFERGSRGDCAAVPGDGFVA